MTEKIAIIGGKSGKMGGAMARSLDADLFLTNSSSGNNVEAVQSSDVVILAIKPQMIKEVLQEMKDSCAGKLIVSVAAGVTMESIAQQLGRQDQKIVRVMPNLGARVGESMSVWVVNDFVTEQDKEIVRKVLVTIGKEVEVDDEDFIDAATAISGSGPAYLFSIVEQLDLKAQQFGFSAEAARALAEQTFIGAAEVLAKSGEDASSLRRAVTSKGGTTEAALREFRKWRFGSFYSRFGMGIESARRRAAALRIK